LATVKPQKLPAQSPYAAAVQEVSVSRVEPTLRALLSDRRGPAASRSELIEFQQIRRSPHLASSEVRTMTGPLPTEVWDSLRIAREALADPKMPVAFKRAGGDAGPDETTELTGLWNGARRSLLTSRQHLLNEAETLLCELPEEVRSQLPDVKDVRRRLKALAVLGPGPTDPVTVLRLKLLREYARSVAELDAREKEATAELDKLVRRAGSTLSGLCGIASRS
jgi:hypothetical protein